MAKKQVNRSTRKTGERLTASGVKILSTASCAGLLAGLHEGLAGGALIPVLFAFGGLATVALAFFVAGKWMEDGGPLPRLPKLYSVRNAALALRSFRQR